MKKAKKVVALLLCAVLLVVGSVTGTMAYLTSQDEVVNTFTVGKVAITLDEAVVNEYGVAAGGRTSETNDYKLIPGHTYEKDPTVTVVADSESSYVRMIVTVTDLADLKVACGVPFEQKLLLQNYVEGWDNTKWISTGVINEFENKATYEFRYFEPVSTVDGEAKKLEPLFTKFTMPKTATNGQILNLEEMEIKVVAHAIQADGFTATDGKTAEQNAWDAFDNN